MATAEITVRHCHGLAEFEECVEIQKRVWGGADIEVIPLPLYVVAAEAGGQVLGAFAGAKLVGFTMALAGVRDAKPYLHSHMTAVMEAYRDRGVGRRLKLFQRQEALSRGIELVEWTFDPLELKNAYFNLVRLGAIARRFLPNCYGITTSPLHGGLPTDRLVAEWWLRSRRVEKILGERPERPVEAGHPSTSLSSARRGGLRAGWTSAVPLEERPRNEPVKIRVPAEIVEMKQNDARQAARVQAEVGKQFEHWFARSYAATGIEITADAGNYLLEPWSQPFMVSLEP